MMGGADGGRDGMITGDGGKAISAATSSSSVGVLGRGECVVVDSATGESGTGMKLSK